MFVTFRQNISITHDPLSWLLDCFKNIVHWVFEYKPYRHTVLCKITNFIIFHCQCVNHYLHYCNPSIFCLILSNIFRSIKVNYNFLRIDNIFILICEIIFSICQIHLSFMKSNCFIFKIILHLSKIIIIWWISIAVKQILINQGANSCCIVHCCNTLHSFLARVDIVEVLFQIVVLLFWEYETCNRHS